MIRKWSAEHSQEYFTKLGATATAKQQQTHPKVMTKMVEKCSMLCSTDQRFIQKRNTTYRIHTLVCPFNAMVE